MRLPGNFISLNMWPSLKLDANASMPVVADERKPIISMAYKFKVNMDLHKVNGITTAAMDVIETLRAYSRQSPPFINPTSRYPYSEH